MWLPVWQTDDGSGIAPFNDRSPKPKATSPSGMGHDRLSPPRPAPFCNPTRSRARPRACKVSFGRVKLMVLTSVAVAVGGLTDMFFFVRISSRTLKSLHVLSSWDQKYNCITWPAVWQTFEEHILLQHEPPLQQKTDTAHGLGHDPRSTSPALLAAFRASPIRSHFGAPHVGP